MGSSAPRVPHCPTCHCGRLELSWTDRGPCWVDPNNARDFALIIISRSLDSAGDRCDGIPDGTPRDLALAVSPIVDKHLEMVEPGWQDSGNSIEMSDEQREAFTADLVGTIARVLGERPCQ